MAIQTKPSLKSDANLLFDIFFIGLGIIGGGLVALLGLWLWFDYQADPTHSALTLLSQHLAANLPASLATFFHEQAQAMGLPLTGQTSAYWYMARSGGIVAYVLIWLSTLWGLTLSTKVVKDLIPAAIAYGLHEFLSIGALVFAVLHALVLLGDTYIDFTIFHLLIPFSTPYEPLWTGLGVIAFYLAIVITLSFYVRRIIGQKIWRWLHYLTFLVYILALIHGLRTGTDSGRLALQMMYLGSGLSVLFLLYYRLFSLKLKAVVTR